MPRVTYIEFNGTQHLLDLKNGMSVMDGATRHNVPGIEGACGGACACATCHVYVDPAFAAKLPPVGPMEQSMLDFASDVRPNSRLSCQITMSAELDGLIVRLPENQG